MSLTPRQLFKFGFLLHCADQGLDAHETLRRVKQASELLAADPQVLEKQADMQAVLDAVKSLGWAGLGASALGGLGTGVGLAQLTDKEADPEEAKRRELIAAYRQQADRVRRNMLARSYRDSSRTPRSPSLFS